MKPIQANIKHLRSLKKLSQERFADDLGWTRSMVGSYEEGRSEPPIERLIDLSNYFNIPIDILVRKDLRKAKDTSFIEIGNKRVLFPVTVNEDNEDLIEIIPAKASAGYLSGYDDPEYIEQLQKIKLPFLPTGTHRAFPIKGDSMLPVKDGAFVVAKYVENINDIKNGRTYIVLTKDDGLVYKRVYSTDDENLLLLSSDNKSYKPYFDIDFSWKDRDDITEFIFKTFKNTALITVYNTFKFKASVRELGKVFGLPKSEMDNLTRGKFNFNQLDQLSQLVLKYSKYIEGFPNYLGIHAGGILISEQPIHYYGATFMPPKGFPTTQFDMVVA